MTDDQNLLAGAVVEHQVVEELAELEQHLDLMH